VGQADAALVLCDGEAMMIDGGNAADSNVIYTYLRNLGIDHLNYIICTHGHEDHVGGLAGALNYATVDHALCSVESYDSKAFSNFVTYLDEQNVEIEIPSAGDTFTLGSAVVTVIGPISESSEQNNNSLVLRIVYGETSFLFTGDAEREEEQEILNTGYELASTVLKVGHHGSDTSTTYPFLREVAPQYAVISVGAKNSYGHPSEDTLSRLRDADVTVYRTDMQGDIICTSDGTSVSFSVGRNADVDTINLPSNSTVSGGGSDSTTTPETDPAETTTPEPDPVETTTPDTSVQYVLNTSTKKFHYPT
jgi:competence protein ComEC